MKATFAQQHHEFSIWQVERAAIEPLGFVDGAAAARVGGLPQDIVEAATGQLGHGSRQRRY